MVKVAVTPFFNAAEDLLGYYAEGHLEPERFVSVLRARDKLVYGLAYAHHPEKVLHRYLRTTPLDPEDPEEGQALDFLEAPLEDTVPVTVIFE